LLLETGKEVIEGVGDGENLINVYSVIDKRGVRISGFFIE
jgi:hypothetical protein